MKWKFWLAADILFGTTALVSAAALGNTVVTQYMPEVRVTGWAKGVIAILTMPASLAEWLLPSSVFVLLAVLLVCVVGGLVLTTFSPLFLRLLTMNLAEQRQCSTAEVEPDVRRTIQARRGEFWHWRIMTSFRTCLQLLRKVILVFLAGALAGGVALGYTAFVAAHPGSGWKQGLLIGVLGVVAIVLFELIDAALGASGVDETDQLMDLWERL